MNINYAVASFFAFMVCGGAGIFVLRRGYRLPANRFYASLSFSLALWAAGFFMHAVVPDSSQCLFWGRFSHIGASFIPVFYALFILHLVKPDVTAPLLAPISIAIAGIFSILAFHPGFFTGVSPKINLTQWADPGSLYPAFILYFLGLPLIAFLYMIINYSKQDFTKRKQLLYVIFASILGYAGGSSTFLSVYGIRMPFVHPYGLYFLSAYNTIIAYAIVRHHLMDIEVIVKKTVVFAGLFTFAYGVVVGVALITQELLPQFLALSRFSSLAVSAIIIIFSLRPIESWLVNATNKYLFQKKYDPRKILTDFANETLTILNLDRLCRVTIVTLARNLYLTNCAVLLLTRDEIGYEIYDSLGLKNKRLYFTKESGIVNRLKNGQAPLLYQSYDTALQASDAEKKDMERINSQLCMPLVIHKELVGILSLGSRRSDQPYTSDDIDILTTLIKALAIAISNARLFMQAAQYEKLAAIGTLASSINHEVCNPLNNMSTHMQIFLSKLDKGLYKDKSWEELAREAKSILQDSIMQIQRVAGITGKLSSFAKPSKTVVSKPISITRSIEDALGILSHSLQLDRINILNNIPLDLPDVLADEDQLEEIFFNLIRNASEAIKENGTITINAREDAGKIEVEVTDTGCGIPEDDMDKIFDAFYTTKATGSGYGLSVVREIVWRNRGNISVKSKVGEGTTFYLDFPRA